MTGNALLLCMAALTMVAGACASAPRIDRAVVVHNVYRRVLLDVDKAFVPSLVDAEKVANETHRDDAELYAAEMKPWRDAVAALKVARQTEQALHLAIEQWQATGDGSGPVPAVYACAAEAVDRLSLAFGALPDNSVLYAAAFAIGTQLRTLAGDERCSVRQ